MSRKNGEISCEKVRGLLLDFVAGLLSPELTQVVNEHLLNCSDCSDEAIKARVIYENLLFYVGRKSPSSKDHHRVIKQAH